MRRARLVRWGLAVGTAGLVVSSAGCTHNYYYGNAIPACGPVTTAPATVANGAVCEVPTQVIGGGVVAGGSGTPVVNSAPVLSGPRRPQVVVSTPSGSRLRRWQRTDPDAGLATTRVEGAYDDTTTNR
jgi:hypothetical protein